MLFSEFSRNDSTWDKIECCVFCFFLFRTYTLEKHTNTAMLAIGTESPRRTLVSDTFVAVAFLSTSKKM